MSTPPAKLRWPVPPRSVNGSAKGYLKTFNAASFLIAFALFTAAGCGAPGEPVPPSPPVAAPITDLTAHQAGDGVQLTFSMPSRSVPGDRLAATPAVEILRGVATPNGSVDLKSLHVVDNIPDSLVEKYLLNSKFQFIDPIAPEETKAHPGGVVAYAIRTRLSSKRASANSKIVFVRVFSVPRQIDAIETRVTESAIELSWSPVDHTSAGEPLATPPSYNIYRAELDDSDPLDVGNATRLPSSTKLQLLNSQPENKYNDKSFEFTKNYIYIVRSVIVVDGAQLESSDSTAAMVAPRDNFPPATPQSIIAAVLPGETEGSLLVDLSWSINVEVDFAGYRVYRSQQPPSSNQQASQGQLLTPELLPTPAYRDTSVQPARRYWYVITAVDRAGNESAPGPPVAVEVIENSQPSP